MPSTAAIQVMPFSAAIQVMPLSAAIQVMPSTAAIEVMHFSSAIQIMPSTAAIQVTEAFTKRKIEHELDNSEPTSAATEDLSKYTLQGCMQDVSGSFECFELQLLR